MRDDLKIREIETKTGEPFLVLLFLFPEI